MAGQIIIGNPDSVQEQTGSNQTFVVMRRNGAGTEDHYYLFYNEVTSQDFRFTKSTDGGATFGASSLFNNATNYDTHCCWYDRWTPGDTTGNLIHLLNGGNLADDLRYFNLDTSTDSGTAGVIIHTFTTIATIDGYSPTICKATNDELFAAAIGSAGPAGIQVERSLDGGSSWNDISAAPPTTIFNSVNDSILLMPLNTDDDVLLIGIDDSAQELRSVVYDNVADAWEGSSVLIESNVDSFFGQKCSFPCTLDKTTGDIFMVYIAGPNTDPLSERSLKFTRYSNSTRTWSTPTFVDHDYSTLGIAAQNEPFGLSLCRDQTSGTLILAYMNGDFNTAVTPVIRYSSDDGANWSDPFTVPEETAEDFRRCALPMMIVDQISGYNMAWLDETNNDIRGLDAKIDMEFFNGTVFDADGTTPVSGIPVTVEDITARRIAGQNYGKRRPVNGVATSDGSGNYSCAIFPFFSEETGTQRFQAQGYDDQGGANDSMDLSREELES